MLKLVLSELPASSPARNRKIEPVCCGAATSSSNSCVSAASLFRSVKEGGTTKHRLARDTTIFVSSSARPRDDQPANTNLLRDSLRSVQRELHLGGAPAMLIFDGLDGKPGVSFGIRRRYATKIAKALRVLPDASALVADGWLHQANSLRCAMAQSAATHPTPFVFVIQDDTQMGGGPIETHILHKLLTHDPAVEYIRFAMHNDCADPKGHVYAQVTPCSPSHPSGVLHKTDRWLDRPHIATRQHYERVLFKRLPYEAKVTPEQVLDQRSRATRDWPIWVYGRRGDMARDLHWPVLVDGRYYVSKEFSGVVAKQGHNLSSESAYVHSYLIHAYRGRTQDVGMEQISGKAFRNKNPNMWAAEDGLTKADERR